MRTALLVLFAATGCQALTDPCHQGLNYEGPEKCVGELGADLSVDPPEFWVDNTSVVVPNEFSIAVVNEQVCTGATRLWDVSRLREEQYPIAYGVLPEGAREWKNPDFLVDGDLPALVPGSLYEVSFAAGDRLDDSAAANLDWSAFFVAGDPDSFELYADRCL